MLIEEIIEIADDSSGDEKGRKIINHTFIARARLRIQARKWYVIRLAPRKYGEGMFDKFQRKKPAVPGIEVTFSLWT